MTDEAKALVRPIIGIEYRTPQEVFDIMCDRFAYRNAVIETQAREIERLREALALKDQYFKGITKLAALGETSAALAGDSHDQ
jgi:hypothetical protein